MKKILALLKPGLTVIVIHVSLLLTAQSPPTPSGAAPDTIPSMATDSIKQPAPTAAPAAVTPAAAPAAAATPAPPPEPKKEKEQKDGFNSKTRIGLRGGAIISKQDFESTNVTEDPESKLGADLGLTVSLPIGGGFFMVQPEVHWMQKGYKIADAGSLGDITSTLNYLEIPLLARINFGGSLKLFAFAGPSIGFLLSGTYEDANGKSDPTAFLDDTEYSAHVGLGVGIGTFEVDLRYMAGLSDISDSANLTDVKNSSFGLGITLKF